MARRKTRSTVYWISVGAHLVLGAVVALIPQQKLREVVAIALAEVAPKSADKAPPKPPAHTEQRAARAPSAAARAPVAQPLAAAQQPAFADLGIALDSSSSDGLAVPVAPKMVAPAPSALPPAPAKPKVLVAQKTECREELVKATPEAVVRPSYPAEALAAKVEGKVRLELLVDEQGAVKNARVLKGLGYGLDEAAVEAAQRTRFRPATRCAQPVAAPFVIAMRFVLSA
jgi:periplasmic protein TonB